MQVEIIDSQATPDLNEKACAALTTAGVVVLRDLFSASAIQTLTAASHELVQKPSIGGSSGYYAKDCTKRLFDPLLMGKEAVDVVTNKTLIGACEYYLGSDVILSEVFGKFDLGINDVYFPVHRDFFTGMHIGGNQSAPVTEELMAKPFAVGAILYLDDTDEGAFCYALGSQNHPSEHGSRLKTYPKSVQREIKKSMVPIKGKVGDVVLFDDRGFHGPDQPTHAQRLVIIFDYFSTKALGRVMKSPPPVLLNSLSHLDDHQLLVLGKDAEVLIDYENHHTRQYSRHQFYEPVSYLIELGFRYERFRRKLRNRVRGFEEPCLPEKVNKYRLR